MSTSDTAFNEINNKRLSNVAIKIVFSMCVVLHNGNSKKEQQNHLQQLPPLFQLPNISYQADR